MDSDTLGGFFFYLLIVSPILSWILRPGRFSRERGLAYAIGFLSLIAVTTVYLKVQEQNENFYHVLGVSRDGTLSDIKRAYRVRSIDLHPDKNPSANATEEFNRLRLAFDVLSDTDKRKAYELFGEAVATGLEGVRDNVEQVTSVLSFYIVWGLMAYLLTLGDSGNARSFIYVGGIAMLLVELNLKFTDYELSTTVLPQMTTSEFVSLMQAVFPVYLNGCRALGGFLSQNLLEDNFHVSIALLQSNQRILAALRDLHIEVQALQRKTGGKPVKNVPSLNPRRWKLDKVEGKQQQQQQSDDDDDKKEGDAASSIQNLTAPTAEVQDPPKSKIPTFVYVMGAYLVFNYFFQ